MRGYTVLANVIWHVRATTLKIELTINRLIYTHVEQLDFS